MEQSKMRLCHSVWTKPMMTKRWGIENQLTSNLWLFALSVHYAKKSGAKIVLHTDETGERLYGFLPYDDICLTLKNLDIHPRFWAAGKIMAQEAEPIGSIHIDGDVFIKTERTLKCLEFNDYDLIVQNIENCSGYGSQQQTVVDALADSEYIKFVSPKGAYNCGIIGFNSEKLKKDYIGNYKKMVETCCLSSGFLSAINNYNVDACPDLTLEQIHLYSLSQTGGCSVKTLLNGYGDMNAQANQIGYTHVIGSSKYEKIGQVKSRLKAENQELYNKVETKLKEIIL